MNCYGPLAAWYDSLTGDIPYNSFADFYEAEFARDGGEFRLLLDLCCGTGTLTCEMARRGYDMIAADMSEDMLIEAREKAVGLSPAPLFLCQSAQELDLYGTVDAAYCSLDGLNYIPAADLDGVFRRLRLFIRPGGLFIFDIKTPQSLRALDGSISLDEGQDMLCIWRADFDDDAHCLVYGMDIFTRAGRLWRREGEEHIEYAHEPEELITALARHGFTDIRTVDDCPQHAEGRLFIRAMRGS